MPKVSGDCDDANVVNGDGCSRTCAIEDGWYCFGGSGTT
jgi:cysteine-rich repeat protein